MRKQRRERFENGFNQLSSNHLAHNQSRQQAPSLLQLTVIDVLLVRSFSSSVGATQPSGPYLASAPCYVRSHNSVRCWHWLFCQLGQEPHLSLQHHRLDISGRCSGLSVNRYGRDSNRATLRLANCIDRNCVLVHSRVAIQNSTRSVKVYEGLRKRRTRGGDRCCTFHARLLPPARIPWRGRARELKPLGAPIQSLAVARLDCISMRWFVAAVFQEILHKEEQG